MFGFGEARRTGRLVASGTGWLLCAALTACSDAAVEPRGNDASAGQDSVAGDASLGDGTGGVDVSQGGQDGGGGGGGVDVSQGVDVGPIVDAGAAADSVATDAVESDGATTADAVESDGAATTDAADDAAAGGGADAGASDAAADTGADDAGAPDPCGVCPWDKRPTGDHPGAKGSYSLLEPKKIEYGSGLLQGYKEMLVFQPLQAGPHPVLLFVPGKSLYATGGLIGQLGHAYKAFCEHVAQQGVIVAFVRVETGVTDGDHARMAKDLLEAQAKLFASISTADPDRLAYAGHSMGAKVAVLAATTAIDEDPKGAHADPKLVVTMNFSNEKPPLGVYVDAAEKAEGIAADSKVFFDLLTTADDAIAPLDVAGKPNTQALYDALKMPTRQIIVLHGTGKDDPNPKTNPELFDDHGAPLSIEGKPGGLADFVMPASHLDALDWYGYWKHVAGAMRYHFLGGDAKWAYGAMRTHGGTLPGGEVITHEVKAQGWTTLP